MLFKWIRLNYLYFIIIALLGLLIRINVGNFIEIPYNHILHAHSHTAFLGWVYPTLFILLINCFLNEKHRNSFKRQLILTHILILAMLIAFLMQGYGFYSILFSSLFQLLNYWFIFSFLSALKKENQNPSVALIFLKVALWSLFLSTFGPWALGAIMAMGLAKTEMYNMAIYFYLHFQYNGWIIFALFALLFRQVEPLLNPKDHKKAMQFLTFMTLALIPGYSLSLLNIFNTPWNFSLAALSAILQIQALYFLILIILSIHKNWFAVLKDWSLQTLFLVFFSSFIFKILLQFLSVIPALKDLAFNNHNIIIAYLHLTMLGVISSLILLLLGQKKILLFDRLFSKTGLILFLCGFAITEIILGFQFTGIYIFSVKNVLAAFTAILFAGVIFISFGFRKAGHHEG